jgi:hypothetical protein
MKVRGSPLIIPLDHGSGGSGSRCLPPGEGGAKGSNGSEYINAAFPDFPRNIGFGHSCVPSCIGPVLTI